jgi:hypothetical protein
VAAEADFSGSSGAAEPITNFDSFYDDFYGAGGPGEHAEGSITN